MGLTVGLLLNMDVFILFRCTGKYEYHVGVERLYLFSLRVLREVSLLFNCIRLRRDNLLSSSTVFYTTALKLQHIYNTTTFLMYSIVFGPWLLKRCIFFTLQIQIIYYKFVWN